MIRHDSSSLQRLLKYPHAAVFDKSPGSLLALRLRNPAGLTWDVSGGVLRLVTGQRLFWNGTHTFDGDYDWGITRRDYDLADKTVGQLADELREDGHEIAFANPDVANLGAEVLIAASGDQDTSNGDHAYAYTSLLWCILGGYAVELDQARGQIEVALRQMVLTQAEGEWLDVWAQLYGVPRIGNESDGALQARIPDEVFRLRVNGLAIEEAVKDIAGQVVRIDEPWQRMFTLDVSSLSGNHYLQDGRRHTYHVIEPVGTPGTDWSKALPVIVRNKAAGIEILAPRVEHPAVHITAQPPVEYRVENARVDVRGCGAYGPNDQVLCVMRLSDGEHTPNHPVARTDTHFIYQEAFTVSHHQRHVLYDGEHQYDGVAFYNNGVRYWVKVADAGGIGLRLEQQIAPPQSIAMAAVVLSDGLVLGDQNTVLGRGEFFTAFDPEPVLSDSIMLSHYSTTTTQRLVEEISIAESHDGLVNDSDQLADNMQTDTTSHSAPEFYSAPDWSGEWGGGTWDPSWRNSNVAITHTNGPLDFLFDGDRAYNGYYQYVGYRFPFAS